jgi:hypothetical protein
MKEIKAIITEFTSNKRIERTVKGLYKTEDDILKFKSSTKDDLIHRQSISTGIRKTDFYFIYQVDGLWQMNDKTSLFNKLFKFNSKGKVSKDIKIDKTTIEVDGKLRSLKITAAVSRSWSKLMQSMPITPSEVKFVKSVISMPSGVMSPKQYMTLKDIKAKVNRRRPVNS